MPDLSAEESHYFATRTGAFVLTVKRLGADLTSDKDLLGSINALYASAFPKEEQASLRFLIGKAESHSVDFSAYFDGEEFVGLSYAISRGDTTYLWRLATVPALRSQGYGTQILHLLVERHAPHKLVTGRTEEGREFYRRNGFHDLGYRCRLNGVTLDVISRGGRVASGDLMATLKEFYGRWGMLRSRVLPRASAPKIVYNEEYVEVNGISQYLLHYPNPDSNDVVLMLHGGPGVPNSVMAYQHERFYDARDGAPTRMCSVVYYDQRATGKTQLKSKTTAADLGWDLLLEDLRQTVAYLKQRYDTDRIILVGHSFGSMLGNDFVTTYPDDVLAFVGSGVVTDSNRQGEVFYQHIRDEVTARGNKRDLKTLQKVNPAYPHLDADEFTTGVKVLGDLEMKYGYTKVAYMPLLRKSPLVTLRDFAQIPKSGKLTQKLVAEVEHNYDITGIEKYDVPVFYVLGRKDLWTSSEIAAEHLNRLEAPQKGLYWIEGAGHFIDTDEPGEFFGIIREILETLV